MHFEADMSVIIAVICGVAAVIIVITLLVMRRKGMFRGQQYCDGGEAGPSSGHLYKKESGDTFEASRKRRLGGQLGTCSKAH